MERVVKGFTGYSKEKEGKPATHIILTVDEHQELLREIQLAKYDAENTRVKANNEMMDYKKQSDEIVANEKENSQESIKAINNDLDSANREIDRLNDLNANLLRISKERANVKRGIKPKKTHHGYLILDSQQQNYVFRYYYGQKSYSDNFPCWKVRVQSPHDSSISYNTITKTIYEDLTKIFGSALGIDSICDVSEYNHDNFRNMWDGDKNFIFKTSYKANIKSGLWEVEYWVKASITVPEDMRAM